MPPHKSIAELNACFNETPGLSFHEGEGGLACAHVDTPACRGEIYLHGAHATRWRPAGHDEVLWLSSRANFFYDTAIRGGVPVCFPWFAGRVPDDHPDPDHAPSHGYARTALWDVDTVYHTDAGTAVSLKTHITPFDICMTASFGNLLGLAMWVENKSDRPARYEQALHTYFTVSQIRQVEVAGLEDAPYTDTTGGGAVECKATGTPIAFDRETDRIYRSEGTCTIHDPGLSRKIVIEKTGSGSTVVWNPWTDKAKAMSDFGDDEWPGMLCVETANIGEAGITLEPGGTHAMATTIRVDRV